MSVVIGLRSSLLVPRISLRVISHYTVPAYPLSSPAPNPCTGLGCKAAKEKKYPGIAEYDDFEYGMLDSKLPALRWVMGEECHFLDT